MKEEITTEDRYSTWETYNVVKGKVVTEIVHTEKMTPSQALKKLKCNAIMAMLD